MQRQQGPGSDSRELTLGISGICGDQQTHTSNGTASAQFQSNVALYQQESIIHDYPNLQEEPESQMST